MRRRWAGGAVGAVSGSVRSPGGISFFPGCPVCWAPFFGGVCGDGEEGVGEHGEGDMSVPGVPGADLVIIESEFVLAGSEAFLDGPACAGHADEFSESGMVGVIAAVERKFTVVDGPTDQVVVVGALGVDKRPVIDSEPFRADAAGATLPRIPSQPSGELVEWEGRCGGVGELCVLGHCHHRRDTACFEVLAQAGVLAEFLIRGEPGKRYPRGASRPDHLDDLRRPGREGDLGRDTSTRAAGWVG